MARGHKPPHGAAATDRLLGAYLRGGAHPAGDLPDLVEADVWYSPAAAAAPTPGTTRAPEAANPADRSARRGSAAVGGLSRAFADGRHHRAAAAAAASAPVQVPAWPARFAEQPLRPEQDAGEDADVWAPPHVYLARKQAAAAASVVEGAGRTLKGRDITRVRDAVWSRTGFDG